MIDIRKKYTILCPGKNITEIQEENVAKVLKNRFTTVVLDCENPFAGFVETIFSKAFFVEGISSKLSAVILHTSKYNKMDKLLKKNLPFHGELQVWLVDEYGNILNF